MRHAAWMPGRLSLESGSAGQHNLRVCPINFIYLASSQQCIYRSLTRQVSSCRYTDPRSIVRHRCRSPVRCHMQYSRAERKTVYCSLRCRQIFCRPENSSLRKSKAIKKVVRRHRLTVSYFSEEDLIQILRHLLKEGVFESKHTAQSVYPELFPPPAVQQETEQVSKPSSMPDQNLSIMDEQRAWLRE